MATLNLASILFYTTKRVKMDGTVHLAGI